MLEVQLAGANFRPKEAKAIIYTLEEGDTLRLERDPSNEYDSSAVRVIEPVNEEFIGFIPKSDNEELAARMDAGEEFTCVVLMPSGLKPMLRIDEA